MSILTKLSGLTKLSILTKLYILTKLSTLLSILNLVLKALKITLILLLMRVHDVHVYVKWPLLRELEIYNDGALPYEMKKNSF